MKAYVVINSLQHDSSIGIPHCEYSDTLVLAAMPVSLFPQSVLDAQVTHSRSKMQRDLGGGFSSPKRTLPTKSFLLVIVAAALVYVVVVFPSFTSDGSITVSTTSPPIFGDPPVVTPKGLVKPLIITKIETRATKVPAATRSSLEEEASSGGEVDTVPSVNIVQFETYASPRYEGNEFRMGRFGHGALDPVFSLADYKTNENVFGRPSSAQNGDAMATGSTADDIPGTLQAAGNTEDASGKGEAVSDSGYTTGAPTPPPPQDKNSAGERAKQLLTLSEKQRSTISHAPLFPGTLGDYRHTYGNCHSGIRRLTPEQRKELGTGIVSPELFERVYKRFSPSKGLFGGAYPEGATSSPGRLATNDNVSEWRGTSSTYNFNEELPIMYSNITVGQGSRLTRLWPQYPDRRMEFPSEHERCHAVMIRQLAIIAAVLKKANLTRWFITHATLLGAVRHGGFIPWDVDIDVVMPKSHISYLRKFWRTEFPRDMFLQTERTDRHFLMMNAKERSIRTKDRYSGFFGYDWVGVRKRKRIGVKRFHFGAGIDIIPLEKDKKSGLYRLLGNYIASDIIFPLTEVCYENMVVPAPRNVTLFLERLYGPSWYQVPPKSAEFGGATFLHCVTNTPVWGSSWNLNWTHDHPGAPNGSLVYENYHPFEGIQDVYRTFNDSRFVDPQPTLEEYPETIPPAPPQSESLPSGNKKKQRIVVGGTLSKDAAKDGEGDDTDVSPQEDRQQRRDPGPGTIPTRMAVRRHYPVQRVGTHHTKLFPRADPHGTLQSDFRTPYMKYTGVDQKPKYNDIPIPADEKDAEDVAFNGAFIGVG